MRMLEELRRKKEALKSMGTEARAEARAAGVSSYSIDRVAGTFIVEEKPDGSTVRVAVASISASAVPKFFHC